MKGTKADLLQELEERLRFETLLADISTRFINLPTDRIDSEIEEAQRRICKCLDLDLSTLWQESGERPAVVTLTHLYSPPTGPSRPDRLDAQESFPWVFQKLLRKETLAFSTEQMPPEAHPDQETYRYYGIKSSVVLPLSAGGGPLIGILSFNTLWNERNWPAETVNRLSLVAQIFSNALARKESDRILQESEARLRLAADSAGAMLWNFEIVSGHMWTTEQSKEFFGFAPDSKMSLEGFLHIVHPEDRPLLRQAMNEAILSGMDNSVEYRIVRPDGSVRWILSRGRPYPVPASRMMGVSIDITERKMIEERILMSEARLAAAVDAAALGFYEMGGDLRVRFYDDRMRNCLGITPADEEHGREFWLAHIHPDDLPRIADQSRQVLAGGVDRFAGEYRYLHPERGLTWLQHISRVLERNTNGKAMRVVGVMQDITERKLKEETLMASKTALRDSQKDLRRLAGRLISTQEEELRRLSRELHDDLTQRLAVLAIEAGKLESQSGTAEHPVHAECLQKISRIKEQLISVSEDVHRISRQLHPTILDDLGLVRAIESECAALQMRENLVIIFKSEDVPDRIANDISLCFYRIVQEGLRNIISHSGATRCEIFLKTAGDALCLSVRDQGMGFNQAEVRNKPGLGLSSMRERMQLVQGDFAIDSRPGQGTVIRVSVPLHRSGT